MTEQELIRQYLFNAFEMLLKRRTQLFDRYTQENDTYKRSEMWDDIREFDKVLDDIGESIEGIIRLPYPNV